MTRRHPQPTPSDTPYTFWNPKPAASRLNPHTASTDHQPLTARALDFGAFRRLSSLLRGDHRGIVTAAGSERGDAREYIPGQDQVRAIDWAVTARTNTCHVRETIADRNLTIVAIIDLSASMYWGTTTHEKRHTAIAALGAFTYLGAQNGDSTAAYAAHGQGTTTIRKTTGTAGIHQLVRTLHNVPEHPGSPDIAGTVNSAQRAYPQRGLRLIVSDFANPTTVTDIAPLAHRHTVIAIQVTDPSDHQLPQVGLLTVQDPETGQLLDVNTHHKHTRDRFRDAASQHYATVATQLRQAGCHHLTLRTDRDWVADTAKFVRQFKTTAHALTRAHQGTA